MQTTVGINAWVAHYNPSVFPEPEVFRPERWLDAGSKDLQEQYYIPVSTHISFYS